MRKDYTQAFNERLQQLTDVMLYDNDELLKWLSDDEGIYDVVHYLRNALQSITNATNGDSLATNQVLGSVWKINKVMEKYLRSKTRGELESVQSLYE